MVGIYKKLFLVLIVGVFDAYGMSNETSETFPVSDRLPNNRQSPIHFTFSPQLGIALPQYDGKNSINDGSFKGLAKEVVFVGVTGGIQQGIATVVAQSIIGSFWTLWNAVVPNQEQVEEQYRMRLAQKLELIQLNQKVLNDLQKNLDSCPAGTDSMECKEARRHYENAIKLQAKYIKVFLRSQDRSNRKQPTVKKNNLDKELLQVAQNTDNKLNEN